jgi:hypothetical protein
VVVVFLMGFFFYRLSFLVVGVGLGVVVGIVDSHVAL